MIYEITKELAAELESRGVPLPVVYGPEKNASTAINRSRIVLERDRQNGDQSLGPRSQQKNPALANVRAMGCVLRVFAQSTLAGANVWDHERLADQAIDRIEIALRKVITKRRTAYRITSARLLSAQDLELLDLKTWPGVVYELRFQVDRGVLDTSWQGEALPTATIGPGGVAIDGSTKVTVNGVGTPEASCGG